MLFVSCAYPGHIHDFAIFKALFAGFDFSAFQVFVDLGFLGIKNVVKGSVFTIPHKRVKKEPLSSQQSAENKEMSRVRVVIENVIAKLKSFFVLRIENRMRIKSKLDDAFALCAALANFKSATRCLS